MSKCANSRFAWVSPLANFKKSLFSNKHKEVIANNGTNKGASETKLFSHVGVNSLFHTYVVFQISPKSGLAHLCLKHSDHLMTSGEFHFGTRKNKKQGQKTKGF